MEINEVEISSSLPPKVLIYHSILACNMSIEREEHALYEGSFQFLNKSSVFALKASFMGFWDFSPKFQRFLKKSLTINKG